MDVRELMQRMGENLSAGRSFGAAYERGGTLVIPVALVAGGGGGGEGSKGSPASPSDDSSGRGDTGSGGGFGGVVMPVGVYVVEENQVRWVPAINVTVIALAALSVLRLTLKMAGRRHRRR